MPKKALEELMRVEVIKVVRELDWENNLVVQDSTPQNRHGKRGP